MQIDGVSLASKDIFLRLVDITFFSSMNNFLWVFANQNQLSEDTVDVWNWTKQVYMDQSIPPGPFYFSQHRKFTSIWFSMANKHHIRAYNYAV